MADLDRTALEAGPGRVTFGGTSLGYLGDALMLNIDTQVVDLHGGEAGTTPLDSIVTGGKITVDVPLAEISVTKFATGVLNSTLVGSLLTFTNRVGLSARSLQQELRIIKIKSGIPSVDPNDIFIFPFASPAASTVKIPFHPSQQRLIVVTFNIWPDPTTNVWGSVGS